MPRKPAVADASESLRRARRKELDRIHRQSGVYFIQSGYEIKIGKSASPGRRLSQLQVGATERLILLHVVSVEDADARGVLENELHVRFGEHRTRGEWFTMAISTYVSDLCWEVCRPRLPQTIGAATGPTSR